MVLYHPNGRVVKPHEDYLEREAAKKALKDQYDEQIEVCKKHHPEDVKKGMRARIIIDAQYYHTLYCERDGSLWEEFVEFRRKHASKGIPLEGIDKATLMRCSTTADEFFRYNPTAAELHLPVVYPRKHQEGEYNTYCERDDHQMAFIRPEEVEKYIVPWLNEMERRFERLANEKEKRPKKSDAKANDTGSPDAGLTPYHKDENGQKSGYNPVADIEGVEIPEDLLEKIHLYNAMLQLGLPSFVQRPLIDELVAQMYRTRLDDCHLEALEMTVGRFYSRGVAVLDPVLGHLIGTYSFRSAQDRENPGPEQPFREPSPPPGDRPPKTDQEEFDDTKEAFDFSRSRRRYLEYAEHPAGRKKYPTDTFVLPPRLPVLAHSIRHWSDVRRNGSTAAAHTGYPLNVGRVKKYYRRDATHPIRTTLRNKNFLEYSTYRLKNDTHYQQHPPGGSTEDSPAGNEPDVPQ